MSIDESSKHKRPLGACNVDVPSTMFPGLDSGDEPADAPMLGSGPHKKPSTPRTPFDPPQSMDEMLKDGEATVQWAKDMVGRLVSEGHDVRCSAVVLGTVRDTFPRLRPALVDAGVTDEVCVEALWVVPPFLMKGLNATTRWPEMRMRLGPFLNKDIWERIDAEVRMGRAVDWAAMGLQAENLVVVKHRWLWRTLVSRAFEQLTWTNMKRVARTAYELATRERAHALLVSLWPFRWSWLVAWLLANIMIWGCGRGGIEPFRTTGPATCACATHRMPSPGAFAPTGHSPRRLTWFP